MGERESAEILSGAERATAESARTFETLDGLRGLAAIAVVFWHLPGTSPLQSAYLAVDLFFMLSGFVLAYRYCHRLKGPSDGHAFIVMRFIRLYPLYLIGSLLGALAAMATIVVKHQHGNLPDWGFHLVLAFLMLPDLGVKAIVFPFNVPAWSLFYEFVINGAFGYLRRHFTDRVLIAVVAVSGAALVYATLAYGHMQFTGEMPEFLIGGVRAIFGFFAGVLIFRLWEDGRLPKWRVHPLIILALFSLTMLVPSDGPYVWLLIASVLLVFPAVIILGLTNEPHGALRRVMTFLGLLSFPIYAVHFPTLTIVENASEILHIGGIWPDVIGLVASFVAAWLAMQYFDKPVRHVLTQRAKRSWLPKLS